MIENNCNTEPLISVILPVYNSELYLRAAIDSVLNQTLSDFELIVIDDGSTDNSENIIKTYTDPRLVYIKNEKNLRIVETLNRGIEKARGKYIARMDADDICLPDRFENQIRFINESGADLVGSAIFVFGDNVKNHKQIYPCSRFDIEYCMIWFCAISHPTVFAKSEVFKKNLYSKEQTYGAEDRGLWSDLILKNYNLQNSINSYLFYRRSSTQCTSVNLNRLHESSREITRGYSEKKFGEDGVYLHYMSFYNTRTLSCLELIKLLQFNQIFAKKNNVSKKWIADINMRILNKYINKPIKLLFFLPILLVFGIKINFRMYASFIKSRLYS